MIRIHLICQRRHITAAFTRYPFAKFAVTHLFWCRYIHGIYTAYQQYSNAAAAAAAAAAAGSLLLTYIIQIFEFISICCEIDK